MSKSKFELDPVHTDPRRLKAERKAAQELKASGWWKEKIAKGICHYCGKKFSPQELTLDHVVPLARGGSSTKNNCVPACNPCNASKHLETPVDQLLAQIAAERDSGPYHDHDKASPGSSESYYSLTPERVLGAVDDLDLGHPTTGRCFTLNSYENRVYDVELEDGSRRIVKFYRPGRWSMDQILEEHTFLFESAAEEIPVVCPDRISGQSIFKESLTGIFYSIFPKVQGRSPDELDGPSLNRMGMLLGRLHAVGGRKQFEFRRTLSIESYLLEPLAVIESFIPDKFRDRYVTFAKRVGDHTAPLLERAKVQRIHGDCHFGNILWNGRGEGSSPFFLDFDDCLMGPAVQDLWLTLPGAFQDPVVREGFDRLLSGYEVMRAFDRSELDLIEPLRALRMIHYVGWVAKRWEDPAFKLAFPQFGSDRYWAEETESLSEQWERISLL